MIGLAADDLTGAGDASVQFARRGWRVFLTLSRLPSSHASGPDEVVALTTDCRAASAGEAARITREAVGWLAAAGASRVFLKIDSTMRGSVAGQIAGAIDAWRTKFPDAGAVVCPAYPAMGRTVEAGHLLVNGERVELTAFGRDPVTPVTTSEMGRLIPASASMSWVDAASDDDLAEVARSLAAAGGSAIPVGSGGLAAAMADVWSTELRAGSTAAEALPRLKSPRVLVLVTSLNPVSRQQAASLAACGDVEVIVTPEERTSRPGMAAEFGRQFGERALSARWGLFGLVGGDGARAAFEAIGVSAVRIIDAVVEGIPLGVLVGGPCDGTPVFTKAGGFGGPDALVRVVERMRS